MHDLGEKSVLSWGKNECFFFFFIHFVHPSLLKATDYVAHFVLKTLDISNTRWDQNSYLPQSQPLSLQDCWCTQHFLTTENPSRVAQKTSEWPFLVITGGKKWKAIKTSEGNDFLKVIQRQGTEWKLRSELIWSDISDIIINAIIVIIQYISIGTHQMVCHLDIHHYLTCQC